MVNEGTCGGIKCLWPDLVKQLTITFQLLKHKDSILLVYNCKYVLSALTGCLSFLKGYSLSRIDLFALDTSAGYVKLKKSCVWDTKRRPLSQITGLLTLLNEYVRTQPKKVSNHMAYFSPPYMSHRIKGKKWKGTGITLTNLITCKCIPYYSQIVGDECRFYVIWAIHHYLSVSQE